MPKVGGAKLLMKSVEAAGLDDNSGWTGKLSYCRILWS